MKRRYFIMGLTLLLAPWAASAYQVTGNYWPQELIPVNVWSNLADLGEGDEVTASSNGAGAWNGVANFSYVYRGTNSDTVSTYNNFTNTIMSYYGTGSCTATGGGIVLGYNAVFTSLDGDTTLDSFIVICQGVTDLNTGSITTVPWYSGTGSPSGSQVDLWSVISHEAGHMLGLAHSCEATTCPANCGTSSDPIVMATMCYGTSYGQSHQRDINGDDTTGIQAIYGYVGQDMDGDGYSVASGDCDDRDATVYPGATEVQDFQDNDCDGQIDEGTVSCSADVETQSQESMQEIFGSSLIGDTLERDLMALYYRNAGRVAAVWSNAQEEIGLDLLARWEDVFAGDPDVLIAPLAMETSRWLKTGYALTDEPELASLARFFALQGKRQNLTVEIFVHALENYFNAHKKAAGLHWKGKSLF